MTVERLAPNERAALAELAMLGEPLSLDEIAVRLGVSREWVRTIERRALMKMRRAARRERMAPFEEPHVGLRFLR